MITGATEDVKVHEGTREGKCVVHQFFTTALAKKNDKIYPLKLREAMPSVDKSTIEDLQKMDFTLKKCFGPVENRLS